MNITQTIHSLSLTAILLISSIPCALAEQGDILVRIRGIAIVPDDSSGIISLNTGGATIPLTGSGVTVDEGYVPEVDITYMIQDDLGIEVIAGSAKHTVALKGPGPVLTSLGLTNGFELFDAWVLPPTVTLQYHPQLDSRFRPYIGVGVNFTTLLWENATDQLEAAIGPVDVKSTNSWGWSAQIGMDFDINDSWYVNFDFKYIQIDTTASLVTALGTLEVDADVNPYVFGVGLGMRF